MLFIVRISFIGFLLVAWQCWAQAPIQTQPHDNPSPATVVQAPLLESTIPKDLTPWIPWVLDSNPTHQCTKNNHQFVCSWPSYLELRLNSKGGTFFQIFTLDIPGLFQLPGAKKNWPQNVTIDGKPVPILDVNHRPVTEAGAGSFSLRGEFTWNQLPEGLDVPADYALIALHINDAPVPVVQRDENGRLWLKKTISAPENEDKLTLEVFRKISDGIPIEVTTSIVIRSSGKPTEVTLNNVQLPGSLPIRVESQLPARLTGNGALKLQVQGGTYSVEIDSIVQGKENTIRSISRPSPWPETEVWVFEPNETIRQTEVQGVRGIDPARTNLKPEWKGFAAYLVSPKQNLSILTIREGESHPPPDEITLTRNIWLDMDGAGYTIVDELRGTSTRSTRLDMEKNAQLGHIRISGQDQVITTNPATGQSGAELRTSALQLSAESRIEAQTRTLRAVGWATDVKKLESTLHLPPGWKLITAQGVDSVPGTWWDSWSLFGFFFVLLASIAVAKLTRWYYGILALVTLVLLHNETAVWTLVLVGLPLLITLGLLKALPKNKFRIGVIVGWSIFTIALISTAIPFSVDQIRLGLYPQLSDAHYQPTSVANSSNWEKSSSEQQMQYAPNKDIQQDAEYQIQKRKKSSGIEKTSSSNSQRPKVALQQDPQAVVQTGPGIPRWKWKPYHMQWQGPVSKEQKITLYFTGPTTNLILGILRVILLSVLSIVLILESFKTIKNPPSQPTKPSQPKSTHTQAAVVTSVAIALLHCHSARAQIPSTNILNELHQKLTRAAPCEPNCVDTSKLRVRATENTIEMTAVVHAGATSAWPLPGPANNWVPDTVLLNGNTAQALIVLSDGFIYLKVPKGIHTVSLKGKLTKDNGFTLEFHDIPHVGSIEAPDFAVDGLRDDGQFETSISLTRLAQNNNEQSYISDASYTPWLRVERSLDLGIPWLVHTRVVRVSPTGTPLMFRIPLLQGETVTESNLDVKNNAVIVALGRDETETSWSSLLKETKKLTLHAQKGENWTEIWHINCSPIWQCHHQGLIPTHNSVEKKVFRPWPGEKLSIKTRRPKALNGQTATIDEARLTVSPGIRLTQTTLALSIRASQGGIQKIGLPPDVVIQTLSVDGEKRPFKKTGNTLDVALQPGSQQIQLKWQQKSGIQAIFHAPSVTINSKAVNFNLTVHMPPDRWLIGVTRSPWGPAVLFWGYLLTILIVSFFVLGRAKLSPLKGWQWALLCLGMTQVPIAVSIIIVAWFFLLAWRNQNPLKNQIWVWHNLLQVGIGLWTLVALICLLAGVYTGLAVQPDMQVSGLGSSNTTLNWYMDRIHETTPGATIWSVPILLWKAIMLAWSLWLAYSLIKWAKWGFGSFCQGTLWQNPPDRRINESTKEPVATTEKIKFPQNQSPKE